MRSLLRMVKKTSQFWMLRKRATETVVTLPACETALGSVINGDDVVGFLRGFLYAGASSVVSSLWQFGDASTNLLLQRCYQNLKTLDKRCGSSQAQLTVKESYWHPYHWAGFQLTGAP